MLVMKLLEIFWVFSGLNLVDAASVLSLLPLDVVKQ